MSLSETATDADLVSASLAGDRDAFGAIVARYQRLLCSLAYSATGQLNQSEDIAQETFVEAWHHLGSLRDRDKLRPWLCGILRFKASRYRRTSRREPTHEAANLDAALALETEAPRAADSTMRQEELDLLWTTLERLPDNYREPLVLFYRERQSVEQVAQSLDLTEDAVKQRLARGRKLLQEQVLSFVEGALTRTAPGKAFTLGVLACLPALGLPSTAQAATAGAGSLAQGSAWAKSPVLAPLSSAGVGILNAILAVRTAVDQSRTPRERKVVFRAALLFVLTCFGLLGLLAGLRSAAWTWWDQRFLFASVANGLTGLFLVAWGPWMLRVLSRLRTLRLEERRLHPELFVDPRHQKGSKAGEYRSPLTLLGIPLVHIRFSHADEGDRPLVAWIAGGDRAYGLAVAWGAFAVAPISVGSVAIGIVALGNLSVGLLSVGTVALGFLSIGCAAVGWNAYAWLSASGWQNAASGGFAIAQQAALGPIAHASQANTEAAHALLANPNAGLHSMLLFGGIAVCSLIPIFFFGRAVRRRLSGT